jgi:hypothetical protein
MPNGFGERAAEDSSMYCESSPRPHSEMTPLTTLTLNRRMLEFVILLVAVGLLSL